MPASLGIVTFRCADCGALFCCESACSVNVVPAAYAEAVATLISPRSAKSFIVVGEWEWLIWAYLSIMGGSILVSCDSNHRHE